MVRGLALLLLFQFFGEILSRSFHLPVPGNVLGMALLLAALGMGVVRTGWIEQAADLLLTHFALFFVPAGAGVMLYFGLIGREWLPIVVATILSTFIVMAVTGWTETWLEKKGGHHD